MGNLPKISPDELALYRRCHFIHLVFRPRPALQSVEPIEDMEKLQEWIDAVPDGEEDIDPGKFEVVEGGWDHEHCDVCNVRIEDGDPYWANERPGDVDLCEQCYPRVLELIRVGDENGTA